MDLVEITLKQERTIEGVTPPKPTQLAIPMAYLVNPDDRKGGARSSVVIFANIDDLSPRCTDRLTEGEKEEGKKFKSIQSDQETILLTLSSSSSGLAERIKKSFAHDIEKKYSHHIGKDEFGYDVYIESSSPDELTRSHTEYLIPEDSYFKRDSAIACAVVFNSNFKEWNDHYNKNNAPFRRSFCQTSVVALDKVLIEYKFSYDHLDEIKDLRKKALQLFNKFVVEDRK